MTDEKEKTVTVNFRTCSNYLRKFNAEVKLRGLKNKDIFTSFLKIFATHPDETLDFLGVKENA